MVPSLLAHEPRRSARRPLQSVSTHHIALLPDVLHFSQHPIPSSFKQSSLLPNHTQRVKQLPDDHSPSPPSPLHPMDDIPPPTTNGRAKRKPKDKVELVLPTKVLYEPPTHDIPAPDPPDENDDDGGITRCVCGRTELDADEDENGVMVMCETCKVWQHAVCVNLNEDTTEQDYYCEQCRPDLHVDLLKSLKKRYRQQHAQPHRRPSASVPRSSRSHSPGHVLVAAATTKSQPKRRNTMNSRDADYEESVKQLIESTRPDAERHPDHDKDDLAQYEEPGVIIEIVSGARKKRKRHVDKENDKRALEENPGPPHKRQRSHSASPDQHPSATTTNGASGSRQPSTPSVVNSKPAVAPKKRGRKEPAPSTEGTDGSSKRHPNQYTYRKGAAPTPPKRPGVNGTHATTIHPGSSSAAHDHSTRRNAHAPHLPPVPQPLLTSWGLPDYLSHLASQLPTDVPRPVQVRVIDVNTAQENGSDPAVNGGTAATAAAAPAAAEDTTIFERGVKVKWPAKRTSVGDMNKRVRGIIDWVGREQAMALDRRRRREALRAKLLSMNPPTQPPSQLATAVTGKNNSDNPEHDSPASDGGADGGAGGAAANSEIDAATPVVVNGKVAPAPVLNPKLLEPLSESEATHLMEELMKELIAFQEKFGHGAKGKERSRAAG